MMFGYDLLLFQWLNSWTFWRPWMDTLIVFRATFLGYWVLTGLLAFGVATFVPFSIIFPSFRPLRRKSWEMVLLALGSAVVARFGVVELVRLFYNRPRPFEVVQNLNQLFPSSQTLTGIPYSEVGAFPSGHAALYFAIAAVVGRYYPKTSILFFLTALNLSLARVQAGLHWPSDIVGGALVGIAVGLLMYWAYQRYLKSKPA